MAFEVIYVARVKKKQGVWLPNFAKQQWKLCLTPPPKKTEAPGHSHVCAPLMKIAERLRLCAPRDELADCLKLYNDLTMNSRTVSRFTTTIPCILRHFLALPRRYHEFQDNITLRDHHRHEFIDRLRLCADP